MNIHREPGIDDPIRSRVNLGLRRRIWWTAFVSRSVSKSHNNYVSAVVNLQCISEQKSTLWLWGDAGLVEIACKGSLHIIRDTMAVLLANPHSLRDDVLVFRESA